MTINLEQVVLASIPFVLSVMGWFIKRTLNSICSGQKEIKDKIEEHIDRVEGHCPIYKHDIAGKKV